jgi:hypothetical protein
MPRVDRPLVSLLCEIVLSALFKEYTQVECCSRGSLSVPGVDRPLVGIHCHVVRALLVKDRTQVESCPSSSLSGSRLICMLPCRALRLTGELSGRFSGPLARFVPGVLDLVIAPTDASLFRRKRISHVCQLLSDLLSYLFLSLSSSSLTVGSELRTTEQNN